MELCIAIFLVCLFVTCVTALLAGRNRQNMINSYTETLNGTICDYIVIRDMTAEKCPISGCSQDLREYVSNSNCDVIKMCDVPHVKQPRSTKPDDIIDIPEYEIFGIHGCREQHSTKCPVYRFINQYADIPDHHIGVKRPLDVCLMSSCSLDLITYVCERTCNVIKTCRVPHVTDRNDNPPDNYRPLSDEELDFRFSPYWDRLQDLFLLNEHSTRCPVSKAVLDNPEIVEHYEYNVKYGIKKLTRCKTQTGAK